MSTDAIQEWQNVAKVAGVETETITKASEKLTKTMDMLEQGTGKQSEALAGLGMTYEQLNAASPDERMNMLTKALAGVEDPAERARLGTDLLGGAWKDLAPVVSMGVDGMDDAKNAAHEMGAVLSEDALNDANNFRIAMENVKTTLGGLAMQIGAKAAPVLTKVLIPALQAVVPYIVKFGEIASDWIMKVIVWVKKIGDKFKEWQKNNASTMTSIKDTVMNLLNSIVNLIQGFVTLVTKVWQKYGDDILRIAKSAWDLVMSAIKTVLTLITDIFNVFAALFRGDWKGLWEAVKTLAANLWNNIKDVFEKALVFIYNVVKTYSQMYRDFFGAALEASKALAVKILTAIRDYFTNIFSNIVEATRTKFNEMVNAVKDKMNTAEQTIKNIWNSALGFLRAISLYDIGRDIVNGLINGIKSMASAVGDTVKNIASNITTGFKNALNINSPSKVIEKEVGEPVGQGAVVGMKNTIPDINKAARELSNGVVGGFGNQERPRVVADSSERPQIVQNNTFNSPELLDSNMIIRKQKQLQQQLALNL
ncbi:phage tail protein [Bacillus solitudinis]|uniref:phage tail protein n=1 Tax=Bacillus solitudinis TaxID=2014074 RepID=UPI000C233BF1|nr:hypothetical protein [Bacillus solitudinis]